MVTKPNATSDCAITPAVSDMSGVEIISPHKAQTRVLCTIDGNWGIKDFSGLVKRGYAIFNKSAYMRGINYDYRYVK